MNYDSTPFVAIGSNELGDAVPDDAVIKCIRLSDNEDVIKAIRLMLIGMAEKDQGEQSESAKEFINHCIGISPEEFLVRCLNPGIPIVVAKGILSIARDAEDRPDWFPKGKWAWIQHVESQIDLAEPEVVVPFVAIGNEELGPPVPDGSHIKCKRCGLPHRINYGTNEKGEETRIMGFIRCESKEYGDKSYLVTIDGRLVFGSELANTKRETS